MPRLRTAAVATLLLVPIVAGGFLLQEPPRRTNSRLLLEQVLSLVSSRYVDSVNGSQLYEKAARGMVRELNDPYSELLSPKQSDSFNRNTNGRYGGTGMLLEAQQGGAVVVSRVFPHTPAEGAGVQEGDRIVGIDGQSTLDTQEWTLDRISEKLRGTPGSQVSVTYARPGVAEPIKLRFTRAVVHVPAVQFTAMLDSTVGYIPLQTFNENAAEEVEDAVAKLEGDGARGIVLDMRDNGGGIVDQALAVSSLFLREGQEIVSVRSRAADPETARSSGRHIASAVPLVVLLDGQSASATEIVAGALQDHDRALVVGTTSYGKGLVQSVFPLDGGYYLKMTTGKWYTPSGRSIHRDRKLLPDGRYVEVHPDSLETDSARAARPAFKSDGGRTVYGGGGITPDVIVHDDTLSTGEQQFLRSIAARASTVQSVLQTYALELKGSVHPGYTPSATWGDEVLRRLAAAGVSIEPRFATAARALLAREIDHRVARLALGDAAARRRELMEDRPLSRAVELLRHAGSQRDLFAAATVVSSPPGQH
ncbi:MAG TPA: S41 family peptidase [Gemmatimonadaceae bacterium]|nr:S41 family peptidase [Gemmatimonadaceae bacterium]